MKQGLLKPSSLWGTDARSRRVVQPSAQSHQAVTEATFYTHQFTWLLRDLMQGKTLEEAAELMRVAPKEARLYLQGNWRPTQGLLQRLGITIVYAVSESATAEFRNSTRARAPRESVPIELVQTGQLLERVI